MAENKIKIIGAKEHNLKNINLELPKEKLIVFSGLSGSGKSTLAFDTIYAEGHRRYVESLSSYARQFIGLTAKPNVDFIEGLSPSISIDQKSVSTNPRSTVGTTTEIYDYLRLLFARIGKPYCPNCNIPIQVQTTQKIIENIIEKYEDKTITIYSPIIEGQKGTFEKLFEQLSMEGFDRVKVDGETFNLNRQKIDLDKNKYHTIDLFIDRISNIKDEKDRLFEAIELALKKSSGMLKIEVDKKEYIYSQKRSCPKCGFSFKEIEPRIFSFNSPYGACEECNGLGIKFKVDPDLVIPDKTKSLIDGAIKPWNNRYSHFYMSMLASVCKKYSIPINKQIKDIEKEKLDIILYGSDEEIELIRKDESGKNSWRIYKKYEGVINILERLYNETESEQKREEISKYMREIPCLKCNGKRLKKESLSIYIQNKNIAQVTDLTIKEAYGFFKSLKLEKNDLLIAKPILKEINSRLEFLINVGLDYITLSRYTKTLSGGESQRIRLATQIGSNLSGVIYVLDEPSIGLHPRDTNKLLITLKNLRDLGNTVIVVEHDEETIKSADYIVDIGPYAGKDGGEIVYAGPYKGLLASTKSITAKYLRGERKIKVPLKRRKPKEWLELKGCKKNNLKNIDVKFPLGVLCVISGVSGSGKSSLVNDTLNTILEFYFKNKRVETFDLCSSVIGIEKIKRFVNIDQSPIGRTPRSNPATYVGAFGPIRELYAKMPLAKMRGWKAGRFSFNVPGGRCIKCEGAGLIKIEMNFLPDLYIQCDECEGKRYDKETLEVKYKDKNIYDVLEMSVEEAYKFFENIPQIKSKLEGLMNVGLGYIKLGQSATTLSGGEAQRVKLASELIKYGQGDTLYILDEPTTGLHFADVEKLLDVLLRLVEKNNTVIVVEHNLDVIKTADWVIDLGPEGGDEGGEIVAVGTPEDIIQNENSYTGQYLKKVL
jgi:excinuclease ABC subunit A